MCSGLSGSRHQIGQKARCGFYIMATENTHGAHKGSRKGPLRAPERKGKMEYCKERTNTREDAASYQADICRMVQGINDEKLLRRLWLMLAAAQK